ncbi:UAA transporter [Aulographum hederae CBS 113979]|uniref:UAA transporter n=1 Tax=Aulographum hederae CBS 113979 TaxID=1176131 RepID=A0A6G1GZ32_9PEZI|nr:UAA transporter [Aulographum hederae CBS 113979]
MSSLVETLGISALIFGGCCSNVYALEAILKREPDSGLLVTLMQFILTALFAYPSQWDPKRPLGLRKPKVPFRKWAASAAMFFAVNMLNNWAFGFNISVPVHIILRSFGSVTTMAAGWMRGKRYSTTQILSVLLLTLGVIVSAWADALSKGKPMSSGAVDIEDVNFKWGLLILLVAQSLSAFMGVYVQDVYAEHGKHWDENLFYSHFLSLPLFMPLASTLQAQYQRLAVSPPLVLPASVDSNIPQLVQRYLALTPQSVFFLLMNSITQLLCISGVNLLSANTSAVTVTIVLNVRKLVSFMLSIWLFGNPLSNQMIAGAALVFGAGALYGYETSVRIPNARKEAEKKSIKKTS